MRPLFARALERLRVRHYAEDEIGPFHGACLEAAVALGLPRADDLDDLDGGVGFGVEPVNVEAGVRVNAAFAYLDPVRGLPNLRLLDEVLCDRVVHGTSAVDVIGWRRGEELRAQLAAASAERFLPEEQTLGKLRSSHAAGPYDLHVIPVAAHPHSLLAGRILIAVGAMEAHSRGRLRLANADPETAPMLDHGYLSDPEGHDLALLVEGVERARDLAAAEPLRSLSLSARGGSLARARWHNANGGALPLPPKRRAPLCSRPASCRIPFASPAALSCDVRRAPVRITRG